MGSNALNDRRAGIDVPLTKISIGIAPDQDFIGDQILPPLPIETSIATMPVWGTEAWRIREDKVGDFSEPDKIDVGIDKVLVEVDGHALMGPVSDRHQEEAARGPFRYDLAAKVLLTIVANMDLAREKAQSTLLTTASVYSGNTADLNGGGLPPGWGRWDDDSIDPVKAVTDVNEANVPDGSGRRPNVGWMGQQVWAKLMQNPFIRTRIFGTVNAQPNPTAAQVATLFGLQKLLVGRALSKTAGGVNTKLWGKDAGLLYVAPNAGQQIPAFGYTIEETVFDGASEKVVRFRDEKMGASGGDWIKRSSFYTPAVLFPASGYLFKNAVA